ncbi:MAG: hypothetical protein ACI4VL_04125 [Bacilli bacterium]
MKSSGIDEKTTFIRETIPISKVPPIIDIGQDFTKRESQLIQKFYYQLQNHIETKNLNNFYRNIKTLKIEENNSIYLHSDSGEIKVNGIYYPSINEIIITKSFSRKPYILSHELFHMSSSISDRKNDYDFSGFCQSSEEIQIGSGLDEGYTELLNARFFNLPPQLTAYRYELVVASLIEEIVGKKEMQTLYFNSDLFNLVKALEDYSNLREIKLFLINLDYLLDYGHNNIPFYDAIEDLTIAFDEVNKFLINSYINKLKISLQNNTIMPIEASIKLSFFIKKINKLKENKIGIDKKYIDDNLKEYIKDKVKVLRIKI